MLINGQNTKTKLISSICDENIVLSNIIFRKNFFKLDENSGIYEFLLCKNSKVESQNFYFFENTLIDYNIFKYNGQNGQIYFYDIFAFKNNNLTSALFMIFKDSRFNFIGMGNITLNLKGNNIFYSSFILFENIILENTIVFNANHSFIGNKLYCIYFASKYNYYSSIFIILKRRKLFPFSKYFRSRI